MSQPLSIENPDLVFFITTRTAESRLWFINNKELENRILGALARYQQKYGVLIYGFILMGNHYHLLAKFPNCNKALFMRDFNSAVARLVGRYVKCHGRRSLWARRYSCQALVRDEDIRHWFFYLGLNPVSAGIVDNIAKYPSYNGFHDAVTGTVRTFEWIDWSEYLIKSRADDSVRPEDFVKTYSLTYSKLPGHEEHLRYKEDLENELEERQANIFRQRKELGKGFMGVTKYYLQTPGTFPRSTKTSARDSKRPLILTLCIKTKQSFLSIYFAIKDAYSLASKAFLEGDLGAIFPVGTYPPPRLIPA